MPTDSRRVSGPENTLQFYLYSKQKKTFEECEKELLNSVGVRKDGRKPENSRQIYVKTGVVSQAKGSAYIEVGNTKVICSVFDPREIPNKSEFSVNGELYCEFKYATFSCKKRRNFVRDPEEKELSVSLKRALEPAVRRHEFSNFQVDVYALVLQNDGSTLAAAINCAGLALADANIPMYDLVSASSVAIHADLRLVDPTLEEENVCSSVNPQVTGNRGLATLSYLGNLKQVTQFCQTSMMDSDLVVDVIDLLETQSMEVYPVIQYCLAAKVQKHVREKKSESTEPRASTENST